MWWEVGSWNAREKIRYNTKQQSKTGCFFRGVVDWNRRKERIYLSWRKSKVPFGIVACDVCMKVKSYFCKVVAEAIFSLETLRSSMLLILFSFFEVKILPDSALKFCVDFRNQFLCQFMFQSRLYPFQQIKSQKQSRS